MLLYFHQVETHVKANISNPGAGSKGVWSMAGPAVSALCNRCLKLGTSLHN